MEQIWQIGERENIFLRFRVLDIFLQNAQALFVSNNTLAFI
jgi:hypothetical protein